MSERVALTLDTANKHLVFALQFVLPHSNEQVAAAILDVAKAAASEAAEGYRAHPPKRTEYVSTLAEGWSVVTEDSGSKPADAHDDPRPRVPSLSVAYLEGRLKHAVATLERVTERVEKIARHIDEDDPDTAELLRVVIAEHT